MKSNRICSKCKKEIGINSNGMESFAIAKGRILCRHCSAELEKAIMVEKGKTLLYYVNDKEVTDWFGLLRFPVKHIRVGRHNWAGKRYDIWFNGPDGHVWHGYQVGNNTQICHCKRTKEKTK